MSYINITKKLIEENPKFFTNVNNGGYSKNMIIGANGWCLPNCTALASGVSNLEVYLSTGKQWQEGVNALIFQAENFWWQGTKGQLKGKVEVSQVARKGSILCFEGGKNNNGHVMYVNEVRNAGTPEEEVSGFESGYGDSVNYHEFKGYKKSKNYSMSGVYKVQGFIYLPIEIEEKPTPQPTPQPKKEFKVGDIVDFVGDTHYTNAYDGIGYDASIGKAKITMIVKGARHPYHVIHEDNTSNVYGWVNEGDIK